MAFLPHLDRVPAEKVVAKGQVIKASTKRIMPSLTSKRLSVSAQSCGQVSSSRFMSSNSGSRRTVCADPSGQSHRRNDWVEVGRALIAVGEEG